MAAASIHLRLDPTRAEPLYGQIQAQIKYLLASGALQPNDELPSVRALAEGYLINPNTVVRAYVELEREGLVYKKRGMGTFVSEGATGMAAQEKRRITASKLRGAIDEGRDLGLTDEQVRELFEEELGQPSQVEQPSSRAATGGGA